MPADAGDAPDTDSGNVEAGADANGACASGELIDCYTGPSATLGVGVCVSGKSSCTRSGEWGECVGQVVPTKEDCVTPFDDDCDGQVNEVDAGCHCTPGETKDCYGGPTATLGVGVCKGGSQTCNAAGTAWGPCEGQVIPTMEDCPSLEDEDCDGLVNEDGLNCVCIPGQKVDCYSGPPSTAKVGNCYPGLATCAPDGMSYGACVGETLPSPEDCGESSVDEDCDGATNEEGPSCVCMPQQFSGTCYTGPPAKLGIGSCQAGKLLCQTSGLGFYTACYDEVLPTLENCAASGDEDCDGTTAAPCAQPLWTKALPANASAHVATLGTSVWLAGSSKQPTDFGGGVLPSGAALDAWVVRFDADGKHVWSRRFPGAGNELVKGLAVAAGGEAVLAGACSDGSVFDSFSFDCKSPGKVFIVRLNASGAALWAKAYGPDGGWQAPSSVDVDASGNVILAGIHYDAIDFGGGPLPKPASGGATFLVKLDSSGNHVFSKSFPHGIATSLTTDWVAGVGALASGDIVMAGRFMGDFDLGGGSLGSGWGHRAYVARFGVTGAHQWSKAWESSLVWRMRLSTSGNIVLAGTHDSPIYFGPTPLPGAGRFVVELAADGSHVWSTSLKPGGVDVDIRALAVRAGSPVILGGSGGYFDFGFGQAMATGGYLIGLESAGKVLWQYPENKAFHSAAYDSVGHVYAVSADHLRKVSP